MYVTIQISYDRIYKIALCDDEFCDYYNDMLINKIL